MKIGRAHNKSLLADVVGTRNGNKDKKTNKSRSGTLDVYSLAIQI